jgi:HlyD family secretion protein
MVTAPGRIEPASEEVHVGSEIAGKLERVLVHEGSEVKAGDVIAILTNRTDAAELQTAKAALMEREAEYRRVVNGARPQERLEARAAVDEASAVLENAALERDRRRSLLNKGAISGEEFDTSERVWEVAAARKRAAEERFALVDEASREEDVARAAAAVEEGRGMIAEREGELAKTYIRSPISGTVLRKHHNAGETVSNSPDDPIVSLGDTRRLRVRAEVDETDIAGLLVGQRAYVTADAYGTKRFGGTVSRIAKALGKKKVWTDEPAERTDSKVLEVLIDLDPNERLPSRLRVDAFIQISDGHDAPKS